MGPGEVFPALRGSRNFNPPTSCEVGPEVEDALGAVAVFQSTHLLRGGTCHRAGCRRSADISIHPPPARWDSCHHDVSVRAGNFNPPTSCEVGHDCYHTGLISPEFQSTHLLRGGTYMPELLQQEGKDFNPPTSCEVGRNQFPECDKFRYFNPPTSCEVGHTSHFSPSIASINFNPPTSCEVGPFPFIGKI